MIEITRVGWAERRGRMKGEKKDEMGNGGGNLVPQNHCGKSRVTQTPRLGRKINKTPTFHFVLGSSLVGSPTLFDLLSNLEASRLLCCIVLCSVPMLGNNALNFFTVQPVRWSGKPHNCKVRHAAQTSLQRLQNWNQPNKNELLRCTVLCCVLSVLFGMKHPWQNSSLLVWIIYIPVISPLLPLPPVSLPSSTSTSAPSSWIYYKKQLICLTESNRRSSKKTDALLVVAFFTRKTCLYTISFRRK